jgi:pimeloyl-ACP methyl ester carboxylesterase
MSQKLVIIPGWGGTGESWKKFVELAENDFEVHFVEMPCFGEVACPENIWGVEEYVQYVKEKTGQLEKPILLGHSFGGQVAVNLVANNPELFSQLILSGAAAIRPEKRIKRAIFGFLARAGKVFFRLSFLHKTQKLAKKILYKAADSPDFEETSGMKREIFKKVIRQSQENMLEKIKIPTLVVWGSRDSYVPLSDGRKIAQKIPGAELEIVEGGKHGLHIQQPENLLKIIREFTKKHV